MPRENQAAGTAFEREPAHLLAYFDVPGPGIEEINQRVERINFPDSQEYYDAKLNLWRLQEHYGGARQALLSAKLELQVFDICYDAQDRGRNPLVEQYNKVKRQHEEIQAQYRAEIAGVMRKAAQVVKSKQRWLSNLSFYCHNNDGVEIAPFRDQGAFLTLSPGALCRAAHHMTELLALTRSIADCSVGSVTVEGETREFSAEYLEAIKGYIEKLENCAQQMSACMLAYLKEVYLGHPLTSVSNFSVFLKITQLGEVVSEKSVDLGRFPGRQDNVFSEQDAIVFMRQFVGASMESVRASTALKSQVVGAVHGVASAVSVPSGAVLHALTMGAYVSRAALRGTAASAMHALTVTQPEGAAAIEMAGSAREGFLEGVQYDLGHAKAECQEAVSGILQCASGVIHLARGGIQGAGAVSIRALAACAPAQERVSVRSRRVPPVQAFSLEKVLSSLHDYANPRTFLHKRHHLGDACMFIAVLNNFVAHTPCQTVQEEQAMIRALSFMVEFERSRHGETPAGYTDALNNVQSYVSLYLSDEGEQHDGDYVFIPKPTVEAVEPFDEGPAEERKDEGYDAVRYVQIFLDDAMWRILMPLVQYQSKCGGEESKNYASNFLVELMRMMQADVLPEEKAECVRTVRDLVVQQIEARLSLEIPGSYRSALNSVKELIINEVPYPVRSAASGLASPLLFSPDSEESSLKYLLEPLNFYSKQGFLRGNNKDRAAIFLNLLKDTLCQDVEGQMIKVNFEAIGIVLTAIVNEKGATDDRGELRYNQSGSYVAALNTVKARLESHTKVAADKEEQYKLAHLGHVQLSS